MQYVIAVLGLVAACVLWYVIQVVTGGDGLRRGAGGADRSCSACGKRGDCEDWKRVHTERMTAAPPTGRACD